MESTTSLEKVALIKLLTSHDILDTHGKDIINALSTNFVKNNIEELIESLEKKSGLYHLALGRCDKCLIIKYVEAQELRDCIINFIDLSLRYCWNQDTYEDLKELFEVGDEDDSDSEEEDTKTSEELLLKIKELSVSKFLEYVSSGLELKTGVPGEDLLEINIYDSMSDLDEHITTRAYNVKTWIKNRALNNLDIEGWLKHEQPKECRY